MDVTQKIYNIIKERHIPVKAVCEGANLPLKVKLIAVETIHAKER